VDPQAGDTSRPLRVVVDLDPVLADQPGAQHLTWMLVTLLTRSTNAVIASVGLEVDDVPLLPGIDPGMPDGGPSLSNSLKSAAGVFGPHAAPVVDASDLDDADLVLRIAGPTSSSTRSSWVDATILRVSASEWTGAVTPDNTHDLPLNLDTGNPFGPYVAACLAAGQTYMHARVRDHLLQPMALNAWTLQQNTSDLTAGDDDFPSEPPAELNHVLAGVGAVGSALLLTLWAYQSVSGTIRAADADPQGIDDTNLQRCVAFHRVDAGHPKAPTAAMRLGGHHGLAIESTHGLAEALVGPHTHLISAIDTEKARGALQDQYPASAVQASTSGLRVEMLRVDPTSGTACLRCFNAPPDRPVPDADVRAQVATFDDDVVAAHAAAVGTNVEGVREWGRVGGCGQIGDALLERLRPSDGAPAQFSVGFASVLAGVLLAGQVLKDAIRRDGDRHSIVGDASLLGPTARFVVNFLDPVNVVAGPRRYMRDARCPACVGVRADIWKSRYRGCDASVAVMRASRLVVLRGRQTNEPLRANDPRCVPRGHRVDDPGRCRLDGDSSDAWRGHDARRLWKHRQPDQGLGAARSVA
jgi:hypothetical protein